MSDKRREPVSKQRRWVVVERRQRAMAVFSQPTTLEQAQDGAIQTWPDSAVAVYELVPVPVPVAVKP